MRSQGLYRAMKTLQPLVLVDFESPVPECLQHSHGSNYYYYQHVTLLFIASQDECIILIITIITIKEVRRAQGKEVIGY